VSAVWAMASQSPCALQLEGAVDDGEGVRAPLPGVVPRRGVTAQPGSPRASVQHSPPRCAELTVPIATCLVLLLLLLRLLPPPPCPSSVPPALVLLLPAPLHLQRAKGMKFREGYMIKTGEVSNVYVQKSVRHVLMRQGVLGIKVKIMMPHDPTGKNGPKTQLGDIIEIKGEKKAE
jgi:hypothetical protein